METLYFRICAFLGLLAGAVIFALPLRRQFADFHEFVRSLRPWQRTLLALLAAVFIAYGSTKTNRTDCVSGGDTNQVEIVGGDGTNAPPPMLTMAPPPAPPTVTPTDIARGWQLVRVDANAAVDYAMPEGATLASNWWVRGAYEDVSRIELNSRETTLHHAPSTLPQAWRFPFGTNDCPYLWAFSWGKARFRLDDTNEIVAVGSPMSAVPYRSRLWTLATNDAFLVTWEDFTLGRVPTTNCQLPSTNYQLVSAQIELRRNGDFITRSNAVETAYRRVCPEDWDDDGIPNGRDSRPLFRDGDFFGPRQTLPEGANEDAYCWIDVVADVNAHVVFTGDGESDLPDPDFMLRAGETNRVTLLIGKTYSVESSRPLAVTDRSSGAIEVVDNGSCDLTIVWPVSVYAVEGNGAGFMMRVVPDSIGGEFEWADCCCPVTGSGRVFSFSCNATCLCTGCYPDGFLVYEGYSIPVTGGHCGCSYGPRQVLVEPDGEQMVAGVSASFSPEAVIFEDTYTNMPGEVVYGRSTEAVLSCAVHGGFRGGTATFSFAGETNLVWMRGAAVPRSTVTIPPHGKLEFAAAYEGRRPSAEAEDITCTVTFTENDTTNGPSTVTAKLTSVKVELTADKVALLNPCQQRHAYGVGEMVSFANYPPDVDLSWQIVMNGEPAIMAVDFVDTFYCSWSNATGVATVTINGVPFSTQLTVVEPEVKIRNVRANDRFSAEAKMWDPALVDVDPVVGEAGHLLLFLDRYAAPYYVSFEGLQFVEIPDESHNCPHDRQGYYADESRGGPLSHTQQAGAGRWRVTNSQAFFGTDAAGTHEAYSQPWQDGWKSWPIPMGWGYGIEVLGRFRECPTFQTFTLSSDGTFRIDKFKHWAERNTLGMVWVDGSLQVSPWTW